MIHRRSFLTLLGTSAAAWPLAAMAQQDGRVRRIGLLINTVENDRAQQARLGDLREGLAMLGWIEGRNLHSELRWGAGDLDRLRTHASELVTLAPEVIVADAGAAARAAQRATQTIPIVYMAGAKVSDLQVQFPTKFELVVNLKTAKAIGLTIPESFLLRADEVIE
jgi:putative ABC transport system substrate-binding protein